MGVGAEQLRWLFGAAAGISAALAQPPSRPRRVPGGPVAGDWEPSPAGPRAGAAREEEALAAVARPLGRRPPRRPSWALGPGPVWPEPGPASGLLGTRRCGESGRSKRSKLPLWWTEKKETGARLRWRLHSREKAECHHPVDLSTRNRQFGLETWVQGMLVLTYPNNCFPLNFPLWRWVSL